MLISFEEGVNLSDTVRLTEDLASEVISFAHLVSEVMRILNSNDLFG